MHSPLICMSLKCKNWRKFWGIRRLQKCRKARLWQFLQGHPKPAFSEKVQGENQEQFFKNRPKSSPHQKGPTAHWRKWHYSLSSMQLKCKDWKRFLRKRWLQNCSNGQVMAIFARSSKTLIFLKSAKGGPREMFQKSPKKQPSFERLKRTLAQMALSSIQYALKGKRLQKILGQKRGSKTARMAKLSQFRQGHPEPAFSEKMQRGDQGKFFKNRPKSKSRLKGPKALWRKWHYLQTSMRLKCKDWRRFWRRSWLQKCPNGIVMAIFARSP